MLQPASATDAEQAVQDVLSLADEIILGKHHAVRLTTACLLARGHLLIEDLPGVGKTTLAHLLAAAFGLQFRRIQFTSDLLPADVLGATVYERDAGTFTFHPGPIFSQLVLADEVNRATPKAQSALLEAMEEAQVTVEGETRPLPSPFFVVATQNPGTQIGTFPLPESQLDRFLMRVTLGYPDEKAERELLSGQDRRALLARIEPRMDAEALQAIQERVTRVHTAPALVAYVQALLEHTRNTGAYRHGLSPRAGLALLQAGRAWALLDGRDAVLPEDIQAVFPAVAAHRLQAVGQEAGHAGTGSVEDILRAVAIP